MQGVVIFSNEMGGGASTVSYFENEILELQKEVTFCSTIFHGIKKPDVGDGPLAALDAGRKSQSLPRRRPCVRGSMCHMHVGMKI